MNERARRFAESAKAEIHPKISRNTIPTGIRFYRKIPRNESKPLAQKLLASSLPEVPRKRGQDSERAITAGKATHADNGKR